MPLYERRICKPNRSWHAVGHTKHCGEGGTPTGHDVQGKELLAFERYLTMRGRGGNHMQLNAVAIPASAAKTSKEQLLELAKEFGVPLKPLEGPAKVGTSALLLIPRTQYQFRFYRDAASGLFSFWEQT